MIVAEARLQECQQELISQGVVDTVELSQLSILEHQATKDQLQLMQQEIVLAQTEIHGAVQKLRSEMPQMIEDSVGQLRQAMRREIDQTMKNSLYILFQENERIATILQGMSPFSHRTFPLSSSFDSQNTRSDLDQPTCKCQVGIHREFMRQG